MNGAKLPPAQLGHYVQLAYGFEKPKDENERKELEDFKTWLNSPSQEAHMAAIRGLIEATKKVQ